MGQLMEEPRDHTRSASLPEGCECSPWILSVAEGREQANGSRTTPVDSLWGWEKTSCGINVWIMDWVVYVVSCQEQVCSGGIDMVKDGKWTWKACMYLSEQISEPVIGRSGQLLAKSSAFKVGFFSVLQISASLKELGTFLPRKTFWLFYSGIAPTIHDPFTNQEVHRLDQKSWIKTFLFHGVLGPEWTMTLSIMTLYRLETTRLIQWQLLDEKFFTLWVSKFLSATERRQDNRPSKPEASVMARHWLGEVIRLSSKCLLPDSSETDADWG